MGELRRRREDASGAAFRHPLAGHSGTLSSDSLERWLGKLGAT
jgi:hypothetical protein